MKSIEEIILPNGLKLNIFDLSREIANPMVHKIAASTFKVEISFRATIDLKESFFLNLTDYQQVKNIFGDKLVYEHKMEKSYVREENLPEFREELINTFKNNSLAYIGAENFAGKFALSLLREIKNKPYKYQVKPKDPEE